MYMFWFIEWGEGTIGCSKKENKIGTTLHFSLNYRMVRM